MSPMLKDRYNDKDISPTGSVTIAGVIHGTVLKGITTRIYKLRDCINIALAIHGTAVKKNSNNDNYTG